MKWLFFLLGVCLVSCPTQKKKNTTPSSLPGVRVTEQNLCALSYSMQVTPGAAQVSARWEDKTSEQRVTGLKVGDATLFWGQDLFVAPRGCEEAQIEISASFAPRWQLSSSLLQDGFTYRASSVKEAKESLWVLGRETELRMLEGAFSAVFIAEAQDLAATVSSLVSVLEEMFGAPVSRQLLVFGEVPGQTRGINALVDLRQKEVSNAMVVAISSLWLNNEAARLYYAALLRYRLGELPAASFISFLEQDERAAKFFCLDVVARSKGKSLSTSLETLMRARQPMTEKKAAELLQITACSGDALRVAAPGAGLLVNKKSVTIQNVSALEAALGF